MPEAEFLERLVKVLLIDSHQLMMDNAKVDVAIPWQHLLELERSPQAAVAQEILHLELLEHLTKTTRQLGEQLERVVVMLTRNLGKVGVRMLVPLFIVIY